MNLLTVPWPIPHFLLSVKVSQIMNAHHVAGSCWSRMLLLPQALSTHSQTINVCDLGQIGQAQGALVSMMEQQGGCRDDLGGPFLPEVWLHDSPQPVKSQALHSHLGVTAWCGLFSIQNFILFHHFFPGFMT